MRRIPAQGRGGLHVSALLWSLLLAGCSLNPKQVDYPMSFEQLTEELRIKEACCRDYAGFTYASLPVATAVEVRIDPASPSFGFDTGKSYFAAFRLEPDTRKKSLTLRSQMLRIGSEKTLEFFFKPAVLLLNDRFEVVRLVEMGLTDLVVQDKLPMLEGSTEIDSSQTPYVVLLTTDKLRRFKTVQAAKSNTGMMPIATGSGMIFLPLQMSGPDKVYFHSEVGQLQVVLQ